MDMTAQTQHPLVKLWLWLGIWVMTLYSPSLNCLPLMCNFFFEVTSIVLYMDPEIIVKRWLMLLTTFKSVHFKREDLPIRSKLLKPGTGFAG